MEILPLNKKCIFFPTPGQTEQEYLAKYLTQKGWACTAAQNNFSLATILKEAEKLQVPDLSDFYETVKLQEVISDLKKQIAIKDNK
jgi:UDP-N-acetylglucosamine:LPS N-acetylglucosamine transferase